MVFLQDELTGKRCNLVLAMSILEDVVISPGSWNGLEKRMSGPYGVKCRRQSALGPRLAERLIGTTSEQMSTKCQSSILANSLGEALMYASEWLHMEASRVGGIENNKCYFCLQLMLQQRFRMIGGSHNCRQLQKDSFAVREGCQWR
jgi:hypothetical protein